MRITARRHLRAHQELNLDFPAPRTSGDLEGSVPGPSPWFVFSLHLFTSSSFCVHLPLGPNVGCLNLPAYGFLLQQSELIYQPRTCPMTVAHCIMAACQRLLSISAPTSDGVFLAGQQVTQLQNSRKRDSPKSWRSCSQRKWTYHANPVSPSGTRNE